jgi:hypothetical protein
MLPWVRRAERVQGLGDPALSLCQGVGSLAMKLTGGGGAAEAR